MKILIGSSYEAPQAEELVLQIEESVLSTVQGGGGEDAGDEETPWS